MHLHQDSLVCPSELNPQHQHALFWTVLEQAASQQISTTNSSAVETTSQQPVDMNLAFSLVACPTETMDDDASQQPLNE